MPQVFMTKLFERSSATRLRVRLFLLVILIAVFFLPFFHCRTCWKEYSSMRDWADAVEAAHPEMRDEVETEVRQMRCATCGGRHRRSLLSIITELPMSSQRAIP